MEKTKISYRGGIMAGEQLPVKTSGSG